MGTRHGAFLTDDGDLIDVTFTGSTVRDGELIMAMTPVVMQMDGRGREYQPIKHTTASISCLNDGLELLDLYTDDALGIIVEIYNRTKERLLFVGYVTPNVFNQSIDGINDVVTIECVDCLGAAMLVRYQQRDSVQLATMTVKEAVLYTVGLLRSDVTVIMADFAHVGIIDALETKQYPNLVLSESYFFDDVTSPNADADGNLSIERKALSCYDVLTMIAESFRATWIQLADTIVLADYVTMTEQVTATAFMLPDMSEIEIGIEREVTEDSFASSGSTVSFLPGYSSFSVARPTSARPIIPDIFAYQALHRNGKRIRETLSVDGSKATISLLQPLESRLVTFTGVGGGGASEEMTPFNVSAMFIGQKVVETTVPVYNTSPDLLVNWNDEWVNYLRVYHGGIYTNNDIAPSTSAYVVVSVKKEFTAPIVACDNLGLRIGIEAAEHRPKDKESNNVYVPLEINSAADNLILYAKIRCGEYYYNFDGDWQNDECWGSIHLYGDGEWKTTFVSAPAPLNMLAGNLKSGAIDISFRFTNNMSNSDRRPTITFIRKLSVEVASNYRAQVSEYYSPTQAILRKGNYAFSEDYGEVTLPITFGHPATARTFSSYIDGINYAPFQSSGVIDGLEVGRFIGELFFYSGGKRYSVIDRVEKLAMLGDGKEYNLILRDEANAMSPLDAFTCAQLWEGRKIVAGYVRDVINNQITVTLI